MPGRVRRWRHPHRAMAGGGRYHSAFRSRLSHGEGHTRDGANVAARPRQGWPLAVGTAILRGYDQTHSPHGHRHVPLCRSESTGLWFPKLTHASSSLASSSSISPPIVLDFILFDFVGRERNTVQHVRVEERGAAVAFVRQPDHARSSGSMQSKRRQST